MFCVLDVGVEGDGQIVLAGVSVVFYRINYTVLIGVVLQVVVHQFLIMVIHVEVLLVVLVADHCR